MRFVPNPVFGRIYLASDNAEELREQGAEEIAEKAKAIAPVDTGAYRDSIHVEEGQVVADAPYAAALEVGTADTPTFGTLRRAAEQIVGTDNLRAG